MSLFLRRSIMHLSFWNTTYGYNGKTNYSGYLVNLVFWLRIQDFVLYLFIEYTLNMVEEWAFVYKTSPKVWPEGVLKWVYMWALWFLNKSKNLSWMLWHLVHFSERNTSNMECIWSRTLSWHERWELVLF